MTTAICTGSKISVFTSFEDYEVVSKHQCHIRAKANDGVIWNIPQYEGTTYEVTDINGDKAIFVID